MQWWGVRILLTSRRIVVLSSRRRRTRLQPIGRFALTLWIHVSTFAARQLIFVIKMF